jgi:hypothetical protein
MEAAYRAELNEAEGEAGKVALASHVNFRCRSDLLPIPNVMSFEFLERLTFISSSIIIHHFGHVALIAISPS